MTSTKYPCRRNHSFIFPEIFNLLYLYLDLITFTFFLLFPGATRIFWGLVIVIFGSLVQFLVHFIYRNRNEILYNSELFEKKHRPAGF